MKALTFNRVTDKFIYQHKPIFRFEINDNKQSQQHIHCTANHPFYVQNRGFTRTDLLKPSDQLVCANSTSTPHISSVTDTQETAKVYDLTVEGSHTFFVGSAAVWVHNSSANGLILNKDIITLNRVDGRNPRDIRQNGFVPHGNNLIDPRTHQRGAYLAKDKGSIYVSHTNLSTDEMIMENNSLRGFVISSAMDNGLKANTVSVQDTVLNGYGRTYIYTSEINPGKAVDFNLTLGERSLYPDQNEFGVIGGTRPSATVSYTIVDVIKLAGKDHIFLHKPKFF